MLVKPFIAKRPRVEMVPLIDMFFLLLVFFIFGVFSMTLQQGLLVDLPSAKTATSTKEQTVTISLTQEGGLFLNQQPTTLEALNASLQQMAGTQPKTIVNLNADQTVAHGRVMQVLDTVRQAGLQRVSFQAEPKDGP
ncbi:MAG: biopolymer transporter ExbD [Candidatus Omnitrophica bacterium]|nr:biopolymer transporter ExbD [Candidatus Omnitrophota bacterium]